MDNTHYELRLTLRPAVESDFKTTDADGNAQYLYGRIFAIRAKGDWWHLHRFSRSPLEKEQFTIRWKEGRVFVPVNADKWGILDNAAVKAMPSMVEPEMETA